MAERPDRILQQIRRLVSRPAPEPNTDAFLMERFIQRGDENAFAALVDRYGRLVFSVCRRVLGDAGAAEDCTQATFMVLARKAGAIRRAEELPAWLHGTAYRLALRSRRADLRRLQRETRSAQAARSRPQPDPLDELTGRELLQVLDEELQRLPVAYRLPLILCGLEGRSLEEAAAQLGWTPGSVKGRLERGRACLHARLMRRGLTLSAVLAALEVARGTVSASHAAGLTGPTVRSALAFLAGRNAAADGLSPQVVALAQGALTAMSLSKLKMLLAILAVLGLVGTGLGWLGRDAGQDGLASAPAAQPAEPVAKLPPAVAQADEKERDARADLIAKTEKELRLMTQDAEEIDRKLSDDVIEARQQMVELEEQRLAKQAEIPAPGPSAEEIRLAKLETDLTQTLNQLRTIRTSETDKAQAAHEKQLRQIRQQLDELRVLRAKLREENSRELIKLRKKMVRLEEEIRLLERKRESWREQAERKRDDLAERLRQLSDAGRVAAPDRSLKAMERRLKTLAAEIAELRLEVRRLRSERKRD